MATTKSLLNSLVGLWTGRHAVKVDGTLQINLNPALADGNAAIAVTFAGGKASAKLGTHDAADLVLTLDGEDFEDLAKDRIVLTTAIIAGQLKVHPKNQNGVALVQRLLATYAQRP